MACFSFYTLSLKTPLFFNHCSLIHLNKSHLKNPSLHSKRNVFIRASRQGGDTLSTSEIFESFLRRIKSNDSLSKSELKEQNLELDSNDIEEARVRGRKKLEEIQEEKLSDKTEEGFLNLTRMNAFDLDSNASQPSNVNSSYEKRQRRRAELKKKGMAEYQNLKQSLSSLTAGVSGFGFAYCFLLLSLQSAVSYVFGAVGGFLYLQLLFQNVDSVSSENVPSIFRRKVKKIGKYQAQLEKVLAGSSRALSSKALLAPFVLFSIWAMSTHFSQNYPESFQLELAPVFLGFLSYKAAVLILTFRENQDMLF